MEIEEGDINCFCFVSYYYEHWTNEWVVDTFFQI